MNRDLSLPNSPLPQQWQQITFVSWIILGLEPAFIDRQAELRQGQSHTLMQFEFPARISYHADVAKTMLKPAKADQETFGKEQQIKKGCPTVKPGFK